MYKKLLALVAALGVAGLLYAQGSGRITFSSSRFGDIIYYVTTAMTAPFDGQLQVLLNSGSKPELSIYDSSSGAFNEVPTADTTETISGAWTFSAAQALNGDITLGNNEDDTVTANSPVIFEVIREDFDFGAISADFTNGDFGVSVADTESNLYMFPSGLNLWTRIELAFGGTPNLQTALNGGALQIDHAVLLDATDNDALEFVIGGPPVGGVGGMGFFFDEDSTETAYCEVSVTITTVANVTADDFYFGWALAAAIDDTFARESATNRAMFIINDNAGDLEIETELAAGGTLADEISGVWGDGETHILRVEISADDVDFYYDGTQLTQTNAVLDSGDSANAVCRFGIRSSGTAAVVKLNYLEAGRAQ